MIKDPIPVVLEPFTPEEEAALYGKLDALSIAELESYVGSAQNTLQNKGLAPSWRPRVELGLQRAEAVLVRENAALAARAEAPAPEEVAPVPKAKKAKATAKEPAPEATTEPETE